MLSNKQTTMHKALVTVTKDTMFVSAAQGVSVTKGEQKIVDRDYDVNAAIENGILTVVEDLPEEAQGSLPEQEENLEFPNSLEEGKEDQQASEGNEADAEGKPAKKQKGE